jgi:hypothetical protein
MYPSQKMFFWKNNFGNYKIYYVDKIINVKDVKILCLKKNVNTKMTSLSTKLYNKQDGLFFLVVHICIMDKGHQMSFKKHANHLIS